MALPVAERDENICRRDMAPSEKVALGRELEALERPRAEERKVRKPCAEKVSAQNREEGRVRHIVGQAVGMSSTTYQRAKALALPTTTATTFLQKARMP